MNSGDRYIIVEVPFPRSEEPYSREVFKLSIAPSSRQVKTPFSSQANSRI